MLFSAVSLPRVTMMIMDQVVGVGDNVIISCSAVSDDGLVTVGLTTTASNMADLPLPVANNTMVELMNVTMDRAGNYTCTATNARGPVTSTGRLYVVGEWACVCVCVCVCVYLIQHNVFISHTKYADCAIYCLLFYMQLLNL